MWVWRGRCSGMAIEKRSRQITRLSPPNHDSELSDVFENWTNQLTMAESQGQAHRLPAACKTSSLRITIGHKPDKYDDTLQSIESVIDLEEKYQELVKKTREYANTDRLESWPRRNLHTLMNIRLATSESATKSCYWK